MKKIVLMGRSEAGKTTLTQALKGEKIQYHKTQYVNYNDMVIDTPGEYAQANQFAYALALYSYEADIIGLLLSSTEHYSLYPPCVTSTATREVIGIVTKIHESGAKPHRAKKWLELAGCKKIFLVDSKDGTGVSELRDYLIE
ncbi:MAG TPA: EutP/PduV family microcompartment system protein [Candidatus Merdenecus merdavium]|nr:EutP/PduV family microcompartment system protein [Candidatus Merdenecus merdavium]